MKEVIVFPKMKKVCVCQTHSRQYPEQHTSRCRKPPKMEISLSPKQQDFLPLKDISTFPKTYSSPRYSLSKSPAKSPDKSSAKSPAKSPDKSSAKSPDKSSNQKKRKVKKRKVKKST